MTASKPTESTQKKSKQVSRGYGVEQLERLRLHQRWKKMTQRTTLPSLFNLAFTTSSTTVVPTIPGPFPPAHVPTPDMYPALQIHGQGLLFTDPITGLLFADPIMNPCGIGPGNPGFRYESSCSQELSPIPKYVRCGDGCGVCHHVNRCEMRSNGNGNGNGGGGGSACLVNRFGRMEIGRSKL